MHTYRVHLRHGTVTTVRTVEAGTALEAVREAIDPSGFWSSPECRAEWVERLPDA